jgi:glycosyltransferase involved in cell wall biosynthesis
MHQKQTITIIGPAYPLRGGGMATFNERMARAFMQNRYEVNICTFSLQYPSFLFPGTSQYSKEPAPTDLNIDVIINSVNPINWFLVGNKLSKLKADIIIVRYWLPFMAPCLGTILRRVRKNKHSKIICIADNIIAHEPKFYDKLFTTYFLKPVHAFVTLSKKVMIDLKKFTNKPAIKIVHPLYDNFGEAIEQFDARKFLQINEHKKTILFFGFIRAYKGLDLLLEAMHILKQTNQNLYKNIQLVIAGEYYENEEKYTSLIQKYGLQDVVIEKTSFITDSEVKQYFCAADVVIQPYKNATQSGVTPLAYHFNKPMIVTNVGALASNVPHQKVGLVCEPNAGDISQAIEKFFTLDYDLLIKNIQEEKKKYSWDELVNSIITLSNTL